MQLIVINENELLALHKIFKISIINIFILKNNNIL